MRTTRFTCYKNVGNTTFLHFVSEKLAMTVLLKDFALLVKLFYKNNDCAPVALQKFQTFEGMKKGVCPMFAEEKNDSEIRKHKFSLSAI